MRHVYSPANAPEAHMLVHLLGQAGIEGHIHGEALQGAVGELPATNLLQLLVPDADYDRARELLMEWERREEPSSPQPKQRINWRPIVAAVALILVGGVAGWFVKASADRGQISWADSHERIDANGDGSDDVTYYFGFGEAYAYKGEFDNNFDGRHDVVAHYDAVLGSTHEQLVDGDFDGIFEERATYRNGVIIRTEIDTDSNQVPDVVRTYEHGILKREEISDHMYGTMARVNHYDDGRLQRSEIDLDRDGFLETVRTFDRYGEVVSSETRRRN